MWLARENGAYAGIFGFSPLIGTQMLLTSMWVDASVTAFSFSFIFVLSTVSLLTRLCWFQSHLLVAIQKPEVAEWQWLADSIYAFLNYVESILWMNPQFRKDVRPWLQLLQPFTNKPLIRQKLGLEGTNAYTKRIRLHIGLKWHGPNCCQPHN